MPQNISTVRIQADGSFVIDLNGLTKPIVLRAEGNVGDHSVQLQSVIPAGANDSVVNVTPLTNLVVGNASLSGDPDMLFDAGDFSVMDAATVDAEELAIRNRIQQLLMPFGADTLNFLTSAFTADHGGMDDALDVLDVSIDRMTHVATIKRHPIGYGKCETQG